MSEDGLTDRVPVEVCEPHESVAILAHVGVLVNLAFDEPPTDKEFRNALYQNVIERVFMEGGGGIAPDDIEMWMVIDVEPPQE